MICCKTCPFNNPENSSYHKCTTPHCTSLNCTSTKCTCKTEERCFADYYCVNHLPSGDPVAEYIALDVFKNAVKNMDYPLVFAIFQAASQDLRIILYRHSQPELVGNV